MSNRKYTVTLLVASLFTASQAFAAVSADEAKKLGSTLTHSGAEKKANADGTIPEYTGGYTQMPAGFKKGDNVRVDPFAADKPRIVITQANAAQYDKYLTAASRELLKRFKDFRMDVYPTRRSVSAPKSVQDNTLKNATNAKTIDGGLGIADAYPGTPFPIPKDGYEVMWNHLMRYTAPGFKFKYDVWNVDRSGTASLATTGDIAQEWPVYDPKKMNQIMKPDDVYYQVRVQYSAPARRAGEGLLLKDFVDPLNYKRRAWQYLPGQRRVKEAPEVAYDTPNPGNAGAATYDDAFTFNGAMDRYDWKLLGKREVFIPYNAYRWVFSKKEDLFATPNFPNPDRIRWELHRVWVVEATLKAGKRHAYAKRTFYVDEDSWFAMVADNYDARGQLYRATMNSITQIYDQNAPLLAGQWHHDFSSGSYSVSGINTASYYGVKYHGLDSPNDWSPDALAGSGVR